MSLGIVIKSPEGIVLAAESRVTLQINNGNPNQTVFNYFDNATKLFTFSHPHNHIGVVTFGLASIGQRTAHSYVPEFEATLTSQLSTVLDYANEISQFYLQQWQAVMPSPWNGPQMTIIVAGFNQAEPHGRVYSFDIPNNPTPVEQNPGTGNFGITWGGQREIVDRLITGFDSRIVHAMAQILGSNLQPQQLTSIQQQLANQFRLIMPLDAMALQDCISLAKLFISTTISAQELTIGLRGCGGPIDIAVIQRQKELRFVQRKDLK